MPKTNLLFLVLAAIAASHFSVVEASDNEDFAQAIGNYFHRSIENIGNGRTLKKNVDSIAGSFSPKGQAFGWPGAEYAIEVSDLNHDGNREIVVGRFETETKGKIYIFSMPSYQKPSYTLAFEYPESFSVRGSQILIVDLNGDSREDIVLRQFTGAQRTQSIDCLFITSKKNLGVDYSRCFYQFSALEDIYPNEPYVRKVNTPLIFGGSHITDLDGDGRLELIVTRDYCPRKNNDCDRAAYVIRPDVYRWNGTAYEKANDKYPKYFSELKRKAEK